MIKLFKQRIGVLLGMAVFSSLAAAMETVGIAVIAPLLNIPMATKLPFPFNQTFLFLNSLDLSHKLQYIAAALVLSTIIKNVFVYFNIVCSNHLRSAVVKYYRMNCVQRIMRTGLGYLNRKRASDVQQIFDNNIDNSVGMMVDSVGTVQPYVFTLMALFFFLFSLSAKLTVLSLVLVGISLIVLSGQAKRVRQSGSVYTQSKYRFNQVLVDIINGMKVLRLFGREKFITDEFEKRVDDFNSAYSRMIRTTVMIGPVFEICGVFILGAILVASSWLVIKNPSAYSTLLIFILIWVRIIPPIKSINQARGAVIARLPALKEVNTFLREARDESLANGSIAFQSLKEGIEFKNVTFRYTPESPVVLNDINFMVRKGMKVGVVGASGSGKSTLSEILLHFYDIQQGQILIDGLDIRELDIISWRKSIGVVTQDTFLFHDTLYANIAFANPQATQEAVIKAAQRAHAHEFIEGFPQGYQTRIGDRGVLLSGGQRQRIAIARAILNEPEILIFDEATSALDSESEQYVQQALDEVSEKKTVVTIAHRLSTIMNSDWIIILDKGKIVGQGHPRQLLEQNGYLKKMMALQGIGEDSVKAY